MLTSRGLLSMRFVCSLKTIISSICLGRSIELIPLVSGAALGVFPPSRLSLRIVQKRAKWVGMRGRRAMSASVPAGRIVPLKNDASKLK